jgi:uncharacterized membrane protein YdjX (TVP38/TMEM64 family)
MVWDVIVGFVLLVVGSYIGSTMALRGFFGKEYYNPRTGEKVDATEKPNDETER